MWCADAGFDFAQKFLPDELSLAFRLDFLRADERRLLSQIQGRTYANMFGLAGRFIGAKLLEISRDYWLGDQVALEALVRSTDEELKHQELFRRIEQLKLVMPPVDPLQPRAQAREMKTMRYDPIDQLKCDITLLAGCATAHLEYETNLDTDRLCVAALPSALPGSGAWLTRLALALHDLMHDIRRIFSCRKQRASMCAR
jgi:hypothetical protein